LIRFKKPPSVPFEVTEVVRIYSLIQIGISYDDIMDTTTYLETEKIDLNYLLNPFIWIYNKISKTKKSYYKQYKNKIKKQFKQGMSAGMGDALIELHKELKEYEADEMEKQSKMNKRGY